LNNSIPLKKGEISVGNIESRKKETRKD